MRRVAAVLAAAIVATGSTAGCDGKKSGSAAGKCSVTVGVVECAPGQRAAVKQVTGELLDGAKYAFGQDNGKVVVVNFWGSWCAPCRAEADDLEKTFQATKDKDVVFLGINTRDDRDSAKAFERGRVTYPSIYDPDGKVGLQVDPTYTVPPTTLVLDRQGRIAITLHRATTVTELRPLVEKVAAEATG